MNNMITYYWSKIIKKAKGSSIKNCIIHQTAKIESGSNVVSTKMGRHSFCGYNCEIVNCDIGSFCSISSGVIIGGGAHPMNWVSMSPVFYSGRDSVKKKYVTHSRVQHKKTIIGHDVWIGQNVLIKQGVLIGTGAVIGMGSVVTKDVAPYSIVAGNPARLIRYRFDSGLIDKITESEWWDFDDDKLLKYAKSFNDPLEFIRLLDI